MFDRNAIVERASYYAIRSRAETVRLLDRLRPRSGRERLIVFDPALRGFSGHHLEFARLIKAELADAFDIRFYANLWAATRIVAELSALPVCYDTIYAQSRNFHTANERQRTSLVASLRKIDLRDLSPRTILLMHTVTAYQLGGLAQWYAALPAQHRPRLFLQFQFPLEFCVESEGDWPLAVAAARTAAETLAKAGRVVFATNSDLLKDRLSSQIGQNWRLLPLPLRWPTHIPDPPPLARPVFGFYGGLRLDKGSRVLAEVIPAFAGRYPDSCFVVHAPPLECDPIAAATLASIPQVELIGQNFEEKDQYLAQFCRAHFILLPYDPAVYAVRTSGVFIEALGLGRPVITTSGSWMAHQLRGRPAAGLIMKSNTAQALYECLEMARDMVIAHSWNAAADHAIMAANSGSAFCQAVIDAVRD